MSRIITDSNGRPYMGSNGKVLTVDASIDPNIKAVNIRDGVSVMGVEGTLVEAKQEESFNETYTTNGQRTLTPSSGKAFSGGTVTVNVQPRLQSKTATPSTAQQGISPDSGYDGLSGVTVSAVTSSIDSNIQAGNIKKDVTILGVTGTLEASSGEVIQVNDNTKTLTNKTSLTATGLSVVAEETGTYTISWAAWRSYNGSTFSTRVYVGGTAKGTDHTSWTNTYGQYVKETSISVTKGQTVEVYARTSSGSSRAIAVNNLIMRKN